ncbi:MAG: type II secretion system minor pseudopilin GspJ [Gammaproteobacteria bacterium]|nr:type II secretion system minor pseudopilin GspJ [Gammaproteobacteria bacterium]
MSFPTARLSHGFTLFELLVAMSIFAIISYMAYSGLRNIMDAKTQTQQAADRLGELQLAFLRIGDDVTEVVPRTIRGEYGETRAAFIGAELGDIRLEFTRTGVRNPAHALRSVMQRVGYGVKDHTLYRLTWNTLDRAQDAQPQRSALLNNVDKFEVRYLDTSDQWQTSWPPPQFQTAMSSMPRAVEIRVETPDLGRINRFFILAEQ